MKKIDLSMILIGQKCTFNNLGFLKFWVFFNPLNFARQIKYCNLKGILKTAPSTDWLKNTKIYLQKLQLQKPIFAQLCHLKEFLKIAYYVDLSIYSKLQIQKMQLPNLHLQKNNFLVWKSVDFPYM